MEVHQDIFVMQSFMVSFDTLVSEIFQHYSNLFVMSARRCKKRDIMASPSCLEKITGFPYWAVLVSRLRIFKIAYVACRNWSSVSLFNHMIYIFSLCINFS